MIELKLCPFCGGKAKLETNVTPGMCSRPTARVYCTNCQIGTRWFDDDNRDGMFIEEAANAWNNRAEENVGEIKYPDRFPNP